MNLSKTNASEALRGDLHHCEMNQSIAEVTKSSMYVNGSIQGNESSWAATIPLHSGFRPGITDVICARGRSAQKHSGNIRFRATVEKHLNAYAQAPSKIEKSMIVSNIIECVRTSKPNGGRFVKKEDNRWYDVGDRLARDKIGQCLRDLLHTQYKSSKAAKKRRRQDDQSKFDEEVEEFVRNNCMNTINKMKEISLTANDLSDDKLQALFNKKQIELFKTLKKSDIGHCQSESSNSSTKSTKLQQDNDHNETHNDKKSTEYERPSKKKRTSRNVSRPSLRTTTVNKKRKKLPLPLLPTIESKGLGIVVTKNQSNHDVVHERLLNIHTDYTDGDDVLPELPPLNLKDLVQCELKRKKSWIGQKQIFDAEKQLLLNALKKRMFAKAVKEGSFMFHHPLQQVFELESR